MPVRVKGLVKTERLVRETLRGGVAPDKVEWLKRLVRESVRAVDRICANCGTTAADLPAPSRRAYEFLKGIDPENLPLADSSAPKPPLGFTITNVTADARRFSRAIADLAEPPVIDDRRKADLAGRLTDSVTAIEDICEENGATPVDLPSPSRRAFAWMKFLCDSGTFEAHLKATQRATRIVRELLTPQPGDPPRVSVEFLNMSPLIRRKHSPGRIIIEVNEGFITADDDTLEAVARRVLEGKASGIDRQVRKFSQTEEYQDVRLELDLITDLDADVARGVAHDLDDLFDAVNAAYFGGEMTRPRLTWSGVFSTRTLGHYTPSHDRVTISRTLDDHRVPGYVVEALLYHELLHRKHGATWVGDRQMFHTRAFREDEAKFRELEQYRRWRREFAST